ncbi:MAG TPA: tetratricopeptide repeat protein [Thermoanaerobaculia bacterium]|nr:tetratricopeptide repeat protein [Thermoanaerobaculia bacterium]
MAWLAVLGTLGGIGGVGGIGGPAPAFAQSEGAAVTISSPHVTGVELSTPVQQVLQQIQEQWAQWIGASNRERAGQLVDNLLTTVRQIGMQRLPDLSLGALLQAERAALQKDFARARWALEGAERLDPGRPEVAFATASVDRLEGSYLAAVYQLLIGYQRLFWLPLERYLWAESLLLFCLAVLLLTGGLFTAVQMATKGGALYRDLAQRVGRRLPGSAGMTAAVVLLVWPLALPYGPVWLLLYWSALIWGYASTSERVVFVSLWLLLGVSPLLVAAERRELTVNLSPPVQAMENLSAKRLYGSLFTDLGVLRSLLPESPAVKQLLADVHRSLNQWDLARSLYRQVLEKEPNNTAAFLNLGDYFFFKGDYGNAIQYFQKAAAADATSAAAQFNLSQAYSESYLFDDQQRAFAQARALDGPRVDRWLKQAEQQRVVTADGGLARIPEIRSQLLKSFRGRESALSRGDVLRRSISLVFAVGLLLVAIGIHLGRRRFGYTEPPLDVRLGGRAFDRWRRILLPGVAAAEAGEGGRTFLALLLPTGLLLLPLSSRVGFRIPWGYDPGNLILWTVAVLGLLLYFGARLRWELTHQV